MVKKITLLLPTFIVDEVEKRVDGVEYKNGAEIVFKALSEWLIRNPLKDENEKNKNPLKKA